MNILKYPDFATAQQWLSRPIAEDLPNLHAQVADIIASVRKEGDAALRRFSLQFDGIRPEILEISPAAIDASEQEILPELQSAIRQAYANIRRFHESQWEKTRFVETLPGVLCWRKSVPIGRVGLYVPGGTAPLFSTVLMLGIPAQLADCQEVVLCSPPQKDGRIHPAILFAAKLCGIRRVFCVGGAQAMAAMAFGTETVPKVWKIFGPGNAWVTAAKQLLSLEGVAIDLPAGPSEVCVVADATANPSFVAADLLSQAEHGADSQVLLISDSENLVATVQAALALQINSLPRRELAEKALKNSLAICVRDLHEAMTWANAYAPEHLILAVEDPARWAERVTDAGSVFLGHHTPESAGDYASGTNHTLPTDGYARAYSGVSLDSFLKKITFQQISPEGLVALAPSVVTMARSEGLEAHARAVEIRLNESGA